MSQNTVDTECSAPAETKQYLDCTLVRRHARITDGTGKVIYDQPDVWFPESYSDAAVNIIASKYFYGPRENGNDPCRGGCESSLAQVVERIVDTITSRGYANGWHNYFDDSPSEATIFSTNLKQLMLSQKGAFNSPVWFNVGLWDKYGVQGDSDSFYYDADPKVKRVLPVPKGMAYKHPQASACFILSVEDTIEAIADRGKQEMILFKHGSGAGSDNSTLRSYRERLSGGGRPSGPVSFMQIYDAIAAVTKSGGKTRRAAKLESLKCWHPDILEFIQAKPAEEKKAHDLIERGWPTDFDSKSAYAQVCYQNSNLSVRVTDLFMAKATGEDPDPTWQTRAVTTGTAVNTHNEPMPRYDARNLLNEMANGAWFCGDPGAEYEDTIQRWHTCPNTSPINASNPCSEYMFIDNSSCNLASLNLMKFRNDDGTFAIADFRAAVDIFITAQDILVGTASYPSAKIAANSHRFRPLGLGYANLGALVMSLGLPYDSDEACSLCGAVTALLTGQAYARSAELAAQLGAFEGYAENREPMLNVIRMHARAAQAGYNAARDKKRAKNAPLFGGDVDWDPSQSTENAIIQIWEYADASWNNAVCYGEKHGFRNSQTTVLAPTGTIAFALDCATTGIEPAIALVAYKTLAGGGTMKIVNQTVPLALKALGYNATTAQSIVDYIAKNDTIEGAPYLHKDNLPVFDCAFPSGDGSRTISWEGHVRMTAAAQPFVSGAISKTIGMSADATVAAIRSAYILAWKLGLKAVSIYRDGSKRSQPLSTQKEKTVATTGSNGALTTPVITVNRRKLPKTRPSVTHHFSVGGFEGYLTVGLYPDTKQPGELFITAAKEGSTIGGLMDTVGVMASFLLQYGVPLEAVVDKLAHTRFEPSGFTGNPDVPLASSITDYIFRWLGTQYVPGYGIRGGSQREIPAAAGNMSPSRLEPSRGKLTSEAPACQYCGAIMQRAGTCYSCLQCGETSGCS